jgi:predicted ATPase/class 3 adenylate cyclase
LDESSSVATFLFTDIEGSTRLWEQEPERMRPAMARHDALARAAVEGHGGEVVKKTGDGLHATFKDPLDALEAAVDIQRSLAELERATGLALRARCGVHAGAFERRDDDYYGTAVNRAARIMAAGHGGQVLVSWAVVEAVGSRLGAGLALRDLGSVRLRDLARPERLFQVVHPGLRTEFPALRSLEKTPNNLPHSLTSFVGRQRELADVRGLLARTRLLTLTGMGGLGKTRLALQAAAEEMDAYPDGVWLVELAPLHDGQRVAQAVASAMGVQEEAGRPVVEALERHVSDRHLLIVLDNCEHLLETSSELARRLLSSGAGVRVLATSREPLRVAGETTYAVGGLALPGPGEAEHAEALGSCESVRLFLDRASAARHAFAITPQNAGAIAAICRGLDGIPLALELAAARVRSLPAEEIAARMKDRFNLLTSGDPSAQPRQRTLRAMIDWSYDLLSESERGVFRQLATFASGCTLEAVEAVCAVEPPSGTPIVDLLGQLVEKSLVVMEEESARYHMLETVRQYALERLTASPESERAHRRHFDFYLALAAKARASLVGPEQGRWLSILDVERENILAAHVWMQRSCAEPQLGLTLASQMKLYWINRGLLELGQRVTREALDNPAARVANDARCRALFDAGQLRYFMGRYAEARALLEESLAIARAIGSPKKVGAVLQPLGMAALGEGDRATARRCLTEALALARSVADERDIATAANVLGQLHRLEAAPREAAELFEETVRISRRQGDKEMVAVGLLNLAMVSVDGEGPRFARSALAEALQIAEELRSRPLLKSAVEVAAGLAAVRGEDRAAARFYGVAEAQAARTGLRRDPADAAFLAPLVAASRARLGEAAFAECEAEGRALAQADVAREARAWLGGAFSPAVPTCR